MSSDGRIGANHERKREREGNNSTTGCLVECANRLLGCKILLRPENRDRHYARCRYTHAGREIPTNPEERTTAAVRINGCLIDLRPIGNEENRCRDKLVREEGKAAKQMRIMHYSVFVHAKLYGY